MGARNSKGSREFPPHIHRERTVLAFMWTMRVTGWLPPEVARMIGEMTLQSDPVSFEEMRYYYWDPPDLVQVWQMYPPCQAKLRRGNALIYPTLVDPRSIVIPLCPQCQRFLLVEDTKGFPAKRGPFRVCKGTCHP